MNRQCRQLVLGLAVLLVPALALACEPAVREARSENEETLEPFEEDPNGSVMLPAAGENGSALEALLYHRVSRRDYSAEPLTLTEATALLWAAGGVGVDTVTGPTRTAPSAGATYPLDLYLLAGAVEGLAPGIYRYDHLEHSLLLLVQEDRRAEMAAAALNQSFIAAAPLSVVLVAHYERTTGRYGERGLRYVYMDAGYASQNIHLRAEEMGLGTVAIGAFDDGKVASILETDGAPLLIMPVGKIGP